MRFKKCIKFLLFSITLAICSVFFSNDTNAAVVDLGSFDVIRNDAAIEMQSCWAVNCPSWSSGTYNVNVTQRDLYGIRSANNYDMKKGDIIEYMVEVRQSFSSQIGSAYSHMSMGIGNIYGPGTRPMQYSLLYDSSYSYLYEATQNCSINVGDLCREYSLEEYETGYQYKVMQVDLLVTSDGVRPFQMGSGSSYSLRFFFGTTSTVPDSTHNLNIRILNVNHYRAKENPAEELNNKDDEDRDNLEAQSSQTDSDSSSSAEDASAQGTTLLGAFTAFVNALTNASPSNCRLLMNIGRFEAGQVDLCTLDPPAGFSAIASIFLILFCVPLSIATARKVISLFRSFQ